MRSHANRLHSLVRHLLIAGCSDCHNRGELQSVKVISGFIREVFLAKLNGKGLPGEALRLSVSSVDRQAGCGFASGATVDFGVLVVLT